jgi:hypothetical protein
MPKLNNRSPKYSNINGRAVVYQNGKPVYLGGAYGSPESKAAYHRFVAKLLEAKESPASIPRNEPGASPVFALPSEEKLTTVRGLTAEYLDYAKANAGYTTYCHAKSSRGKFSNTLARCDCRLPPLFFWEPGFQIAKSGGLKWSPVYVELSAHSTCVR